MATGRVPTTANSPLTAKGDLFGYSTTQARVAVGNDGETLVADSSTSTGLRYQGSIAGGKNFLINGNFSIAQRGTASKYVSPNTYYLDRWACTDNQSANHQQITTGSTSVPSYFGARVGSVTSAQEAGGSRVYIGQQIESLFAQNLAGKTVTLSFWVRFSAASIASAGNWSYNLITSATENLAINTAGTYTGSANLTNGSFPTTWTKYTLTATLPTNTRTIRVIFGFDNLFTTASANTSYYDFSAVQLELGSVGTEFSMAGGTLQGELAACQRYYQRFSTNGANNVAPVAIGFGTTTTTAGFLLKLTTTMRTAPTSLDASGMTVFTSTSVLTPAGTLVIGTNQSGTDTCGLAYTHGSAALTANAPYFLGFYGTNYIGVSAEL